MKNLKLLDILFHRPMSRADFCSKELVELVFPDIKSLISIHVKLNNEMKAKMKEDPLVSIKDVAHILLNRVGDCGTTILVFYMQNMDLLTSLIYYRRLISCFQLVL